MLTSTTRPTAQQLWPLKCGWCCMARAPRGANIFTGGVSTLTIFTKNVIFFLHCLECLCGLVIEWWQAVVIFLLKQWKIKHEISWPLFYHCHWHLILRWKLSAELVWAFDSFTGARTCVYIINVSVSQSAVSHEAFLVKSYQLSHISWGTELGKLCACVFGVNLSHRYEEYLAFSFFYSIQLSKMISSSVMQEKHVVGWT